MEANLIAGYLAYTTTDEYGTGAGGEAPASTPTISLATTSAATGASVAETWQHGC